MKIHDLGRGNVVEVEAKSLEDMVGVVVLNGNNNQVFIAKGCGAIRLEISFGHGCFFYASEDARLGAIEAYAAKDGKILVGPGTQFNSHTRIYLHEPGRIAFGSGCLVGGETLITVSDMHSVMDAASGRRVNQARDILISDRVWLSERVTVLKGTVIGQDTVVGFGAVVAGSLPANCVAAGVPARVIRRNTRWRADLV